jgi:multicomponent Na+:H+ antiporter subunit E
MSLSTSTHASLVRMAALFALWLILAGMNPVDMAMGALAAAAATWTSLRLLPPGQLRLQPTALIRLVLRFLPQSVRAGFDVARCALDPRLPLRQGFVIFHPRLPIGLKRDAFCTMTSLLPGTLPAGPNRDGNIIVHCLDVTQPVTSQLVNEETLFMRAFGSE